MLLPLLESGNAKPGAMQNELNGLNDAITALGAVNLAALEELQTAHEVSSLPELPGEETRAALNDLLVRVRLGSVGPV